MASRRLAISSLLCADDSGTATTSHSPESATRTPTVDTALQGSRTSSPKFSPISSWASPTAQVVSTPVPASVGAGAHHGRRTPSPSSLNHEAPSFPLMSRRSFREVALNNYTEGTGSVAYPPSNEYPGEPMHSYSRRTSSVHAPYITQEQAADRRPEPGGTYRPVEYRPFVASPPHSPFAGYTATRRQTSHSPEQSTYPSVLSPRQEFKPSFSPRSIVQQTLTSAASPEFSAPSSSSHQTPSNAPHRSPAQSRHTISSLLVDSTPPPRASAASLPHILNSPVLSPTTARANLYQSSGMEGLEALVQAATQERQRLGGEKATEVESASSWPTSVTSPVLPQSLSRLVSSPAASRVVESTSTIHHQEPPVLDSGSSARATSFSPSQPYRSPLHAPIPPAHPLASPPLPTQDVSLDVRPPDADVIMHDTFIQPPSKRRRSSESTVPSVPSSSMGGVDALPAHEPVTNDAMQVEPEGFRGSERTEAAPAAATTMLSLTALAETSDSPAQPHSSRPPSPLPTPLTSHALPLPDDSGRPVSSVHLDIIHPKTEVLDSPGVPSVPLPVEKPAHDTKPKVKKGKADGADAVKSKERAKPKPKPKHSVKPVDYTGGDKRDDTDDWFLEQFGETESKKALPGAKSTTLLHRARTPDGDATHHRQKPPSSPGEQRHASASKRLSVGRSRSPTPLEMLEAELEDVPLVTKRSPEPLERFNTRLPPASPATQTRATTTDLDLDTELERTLQDDAPAPPPPAKPKPKPRPRPKPKREVEEKVDMDVEDELLALLDDGEDERKDKHGPGHSHSPSIGSSLSREVPKHAVKGAGHSASVAPSTSELNTPMPPPGSRAVSQLREGSMARKDKDEGDPSPSAPAATPGTPSATPAPASGPGTSGTSKAKEAPKKKSQAKSRAKTGSTNKAKAKPSLVKERSATPAASPHPTPNPSDAPPAASKSKKAQGSLTAKRAVSAAAGASRSRSTSVMPGEGEASARKRSGQQVPDEKEEKVEEEQEVDDRLYCVCRTPYDEDRVMIACDRCDEWYHTQCVKMPDLEVDLVDQFICPLCVANNPHLPLRTTYKKRCLAGLAHPRPASQHACHKPARGAFSKYCSDECGVRYMRERIERFARDSSKNVAKASKELKEEESMRGLWEGVKSAGQREAVVLRTLDGVDEKGEPLTEIVVPRVPKHLRLIARLEVQLAKISSRRDELKTDDEIVVWREAVLGFAAQRADRHGECGWDGRLLWSSDEVREYGADVLDSYERIDMRGGDEMSVDGQVDDGGWWCTGKRKCDRHAGWQKLRQAEIDLEKELYEAELERLTTREREIRKRIEDIQSAHPDTSASSHHPDMALDSHAARTETNHLLNGMQGGTPEHHGDVDGLPKLNGVNGVDDAEKKGKKRKVDAR